MTPAMRKNSRGFTLIEVLAALVLIGIVVPVAMRGATLSLSAASTARHQEEAATLAESKLTELVTEQSQTGGSVNGTGDFGQAWPEYRWVCENATRDYDTSEVRVTVFWKERGVERSTSTATMTYYAAGVTQ